jgi:hypothetical protein
VPPTIFCCCACIRCRGNVEWFKYQFFFFVIPFHLQSVPVHSANCVKTYTVPCRRVLSSAPL